MFPTIYMPIYLPTALGAAVLGEIKQYATVYCEKYPEGLDIKKEKIAQTF
jgi:hypothetical protein